MPNEDGKEERPDRNYITANFSWVEAACKDGIDVPEKYQADAGLVAVNMEKVRRFLGNTPIHVNSWYRTVSWNDRLYKEIRKKSPEAGKRSQHLTASAIDFWHDYWSPELIFITVDALMNSFFINQGGLGLYNNFVHYDVRGARTRWDKRTIGVNSVNETLIRRILR